MSIVTRTGDEGTTGLMYNRRVSKCDPRVESYGAVDELTSAIGLARAFCRATPLAEGLLRIQRDLVVLMGELATAVEDLERYERDGFQRLKPESTARIDAWIREIESSGRIQLKGWAMPGENPVSAGLDLARAACRHAERRICGLLKDDRLKNPGMIVYLNRLSDLLWLLARDAEAG